MGRSADRQIGRSADRQIGRSADRQMRDEGWGMRNAAATPYVPEVFNLHTSSKDIDLYQMTLAFSRDQRKQRIATQPKLTGKIINQDLPKKFCQGLYCKSKNINTHIAQTVSSSIIKFARVHGVSIIVFEDLSNWKAKGGKHGSLQKQRFNQWCKYKLIELTIQKFSELGGKVTKVNAKYTSASGLVIMLTKQVIGNS